uniref:Uncharacterized protein n=1 Tax=Phaeomonas parva TaxID=124430 RepID=A0A7S1UAF4_9STRA|mmetsp:Transcript_37676/g.117860  ORF Transcript_37676/g.117860 Transcript_37676/m.117860 type:complete len:172 (+) Transcript_37676:3-518(+)
MQRMQALDMQRMQALDMQRMQALYMQKVQSAVAMQKLEDKLTHAMDSMSQMKTQFEMGGGGTTPLSVRSGARPLSFDFGGGGVRDSEPFRIRSPSSSSFLQRASVSEPPSLSSQFGKVLDIITAELESLSAQHESAVSSGDAALASTLQDKMQEKTYELQIIRNRMDKEER